MLEKAKPCPFCGSDDLLPSFHHLDGDGDDPGELMVSVSCDACNAEGPSVVVANNNHEVGLKEARKRWNAREQRR
jgi:Lar family restriction alleviation protein